MNNAELIYKVLETQGDCFNAEKEYKAFLDCISQKNNKLVEENIIIRILDLILSYEECYSFLNPEKENLYRARKINNADLTKDKGIDIVDNKYIGFDRYQSKEAPLTLVDEGRNNIKGMPYLYLAGDRYTAIAELKENDFSYISLATFRVNHKLKLLDFTDLEKRIDCKELSEKISGNNINEIFIKRILYKLKYQFSNPLEWTDGYMASQYIADYVRKQGIDGIMYRSSCTDGINYTIFNSGNNNIEFINSRITFIHSREYTIIDLETKNVIEAESSLELDDNFIKDVRNDLKNKYLKNTRNEV